MKVVAKITRGKNKSKFQKSIYNFEGFFFWFHFRKTGEIWTEDPKLIFLVVSPVREETTVAPFLKF